VLVVRCSSFAVRCSLSGSADGKPARQEQESKGIQGSLTIQSISLAPRPPVLLVIFRQESNV
jgi:hypothetical protein